jgi:hypothetical protein
MRWVLHLIFWSSLASLGYSLYYGYSLGIATSTPFVLVSFVLWVYSYLRQTKKERSY